MEGRSSLGELDGSRALGGEGEPEEEEGALPLQPPMRWAGHGGWPPASRPAPTRSPRPPAPQDRRMRGRPCRELRQASAPALRVCALPQGEQAYTESLRHIKFTSAEIRVLEQLSLVPVSLIKLRHS